MLRDLGTSPRVLDVTDLATHFKTSDGIVHAVNGVSFHLDAGETLGIVGESGCGKSVTVMSMLRLIPEPPGEVVRGQAVFLGKDLLKMTPDEIRQVRGAQIAMVFQDPMTSFNPVLTIGRQLTEPLEIHLGMNQKQAGARAAELLDMVGIPGAAERLKDYPHQFSGGMRQRVMIAMALSCTPQILIADEPTTALDVTIQAQIVELVKRLRDEIGMAIIWITHDLGIIAGIANRVAVMYGGYIIEHAPVKELYPNPQHPYTIGLIGSLPRLDQRRERLDSIDGLPPVLSFCRPLLLRQGPLPPREPAADAGGAASRGRLLGGPADRRVARMTEATVEPKAVVASSSDDNVLLRVEHLVKHFPITRGIIVQKTIGAVRAVDDISFFIKRGETFGLVGESGCGKSTTGRTILQLYVPTSGHVYFDGVDLVGLNGNEMRHMRRRMQMIFQDPYASLNPRMTVGEIVGEPIIVHQTVKGPAVRQRVDELLELVGLNPAFANRYPHEFSGGQRQRIGVARALALNPLFIVCDEPISALDVSIQAQVVNLLDDLQDQFGLTYLFIAHDLSMVRHICDRVGVMYLGVLVEQAERDELYANPLHPYSQALLSAVPVADPLVEEKRKRIILEGDVPSPANPPSGCRFRTRCWLAEEICAEQVPEWRELLPGHNVACHFADRWMSTPANLDGRADRKEVRLGARHTDTVVDGI
jgi:peptide/nickel transport system ATP-binding protein